MTLLYSTSDADCPVSPTSPPRRPTYPVLSVGGTHCDVRDRRSAVAEIVSRAALRDRVRPLAVASSNLDHIYHFAIAGPDIVHRSTDVDWLVLIDGAPIAAWARLKARVCAEVLTGSDLLPLLLDECERDGVRIGFLGGTEHSQAALVTQLAARWPSLQVAGMWSPCRSVVLDAKQSTTLAATIAQARTDLLVVGLGKPRQEDWIAQHGVATGAGALLAFGASADFVAGVARRAPTALSRFGLEWAFRLALEPRRLYRRYLLQGPGSALRLLTCSTVLDTGQERRRTMGAAHTRGPRALIPAPRRERRRKTDRLPRQGTTAEPEQHRVSAVVVTYNSEGHVGALVESLVGSPVDEVVIVDNGSSDGTLPLLRSRQDDWAERGLDVRVVDAGRNGGYAAGINLARRHARPTEWMLVLNPDVQLGAGAIEVMLEAASRSGAGAVVPALVDEHGRLCPSLRREPSIGRAVGDALLGARLTSRPGWASETVWDPAEYEREATVDWATGAAVLVSEECAQAVGDWDEQFFLYSEETDFLRRVRDAGYPVRYVPAAVVTHIGGGSGSSAGLNTLMTVNRVRYYSKHHGPVASGLFRAAVALHCGLRVGQPASRAALRQLMGAPGAALPGAEPELPDPTAVPSRLSTTGTARLSVVVPAHEEAAVIRRCLAALVSGTAPGELEIVVVPNGCSDDTASLAEDFARESGYPIRVLPVATASKTAALRVADSVATTFPRVYLDADIEIAGGALLTAAQAVEASGKPAGRPRLRYDTTGSDWLVRRYYRARATVPGLNQALWGAGVFMLTREGRGRFGDWPDVIGDDLFVDSLFAADETFIHQETESVVRVPSDRSSLLAICTRAQRGKRQQLTPIVESAPAPDTTAGTVRGLARTVLSRRASPLDAAVFVGFAVAARVQAQMAPVRTWERDESSRTRA